MRQFLIEWGPFAVPSYGFFVAMAIITGMALSEKRGKEIGLPPFLILDTLFIGFLAALVGTRVFYYIFGGEKGHSLITEGHVRSIYGALFSGLLASFVFLKYKKGPVLKSLDVIFLYFPLSHAIGRLGCLCYGCCHGRISDWPFFTLQFPKIMGYTGEVVGTPAFLKHFNKGLVTAGEELSLPVYPTQPFAIISLLIIFLVLRTIADKKNIKEKSGFIMFLYFILNGLERFIEEIMRDHYRYWGIITKPQIVSILLIIAGVIGLVKVKNRVEKKISRQQRRRMKKAAI